MNPSTKDQPIGSAAVLDEKQLEGLTQFDSPTIANVIELFDLRPRVAGFSNHSLKAIYPELPPVVGYAVTATLRSGYPAGYVRERRVLVVVMGVRGFRGARRR